MGNIKMNIRQIFITTIAVFATFVAFADTSSVTSKKYVDDFMTGYQNKIPGSGTNKLMIYDNSDDSIGEKAIVSELGISTSAANVPNVGAVKTGLVGKQDTITGTAGYVMTGTGTPGEVGEKPIYSATIRDEDSLVMAETVNSGVINAVNHSLRRVNANGELDNNGTLWEIADTVVALSYLPAGYTQLEYIESTGTQYIDTGVMSTGIGLKTEAKVALTTNSTAEQAFIGRNGGSGYEIYFNTGNTIRSYHFSGQHATLNINYSPGVVYTVLSEMTSNGITQSVNGVQSSYSGTMSTTLEELEVCLFRHNFKYPLYGRLYYVKIWKNGELVREFVPAKNSSNVVGMYDLTDPNPATAFYTNANTTGAAFVAGPAVAN